MSSPGDRDRTANAATMGRSAQVLASGLVAARFLPIWVGMAVLIVTLAIGQIVLAYTTKYAREHTVSLQVPGSLTSWASDKPLGVSTVFWAGAALTILVALVVRYTAPGRRFQAVGAV